MNLYLTCVYSGVIIGAIILKIYIKRLIKKDKKIIDTSNKEVYYQRFIENNKNTAGGIGFLFFKEEVSSEDKLIKQVDRNITATILELKLKDAIEIYRKQNEYIIKLNLKYDVSILKDSQIIVYDFIKRVISYYGLEDKIGINLFSEYIEKNTINFEIFIRKFNTSVKREQKENGNYSKNGKKKYLRYKEIILTFYSATSFILVILCGDIILSKIAGVLSIERWILGGIATLFMIIDTINIMKIGKIIHKTSFGLTMKGVKEYIQWLGMKQFLEEYTLLQECNNLEEINLRQEYLVYAIVLGVSDKILENIGFDSSNIKKALGEDIYTYEDMCLK